MILTFSWGHIWLRNNVSVPSTSNSPQSILIKIVTLWRLVCLINFMLISSCLIRVHEKRTILKCFCWSKLAWAYGQTFLEPVSFKLEVMLHTTELYIWVPVEVTLIFILGQSWTRKFNLLCLFAVWLRGNVAYCDTTVDCSSLYQF